LSKAGRGFFPAAASEVAIISGSHGHQAAKRLSARGTFGLR